MKIAIIGTGYVGLVSGTCFAELGHNVTCVENNGEKLARLQIGSVPFYEPGLSELVDKNMESGRLSFSGDLASAINDRELIFIAVGTPQGDSGEADLTYVYQVAKEIGAAINRAALVVNKSTVPVGTGNAVKEIISKQLDARGKKLMFDVASNPEFLKEGNAIDDFLSPDRVVIGTSCRESERILKSLYAPLNLGPGQIQTVSVKDAEMIKYVANTMLATKISFMNEVALLCDSLEVDVEKVKRGIAADARIGPHFINAGCGYGGSCFPKDVAAMAAMAREVGLPARMFEAVQQVNVEQQLVLTQRILDYFGGHLSNKVIAVWGLSFKPNTDDVRESASIKMCEFLLQCGASLRVYDPQALKAARESLGDAGVEYCSSPFDATSESDFLLLATEWSEFRSLDLSVLKTQLRDKVVFDGRNVMDLDELETFGVAYCGIGRRNRLYTKGIKSGWSKAQYRYQPPVGKALKNVARLEVA
jgi:UDPglucose 6-dehydrogenase